VYLHVKMNRQAKRLSAMRQAVGASQLWLDALWQSYFFRPLQKRSEVWRLVELLTARRPATICEIGAAGGGTTFLLAHAAAREATLVSLDLAFTPARKAAIRQFASKGQQIICMQADSHSLATVRAVNDRLRGRGLDVLYLDGDHSYEGIATDFKLYSPLVKPGGLIVCHDIVPDYRTRYGIETASNVGGVPQFWAELKAAHTTVEELVEDYAQDGFGIGVLHWQKDRVNVNHDCEVD